MAGWKYISYTGWFRRPKLYELCGRWSKNTVSVEVVGSPPGLVVMTVYTGEFSLYKKKTSLGIIFTVKFWVLSQ